MSGFSGIRHASSRRPGRALCSGFAHPGGCSPLLPGCGSPVPPSSGHKGRADRLPARRPGSWLRPAPAPRGAAPLSPSLPRRGGALSPALRAAAGARGRGPPSALRATSALRLQRAQQSRVVATLHTCQFSGRGCASIVEGAERPRAALQLYPAGLPLAGSARGDRATGPQRVGRPGVRLLAGDRGFPPAGPPPSTRAGFCLLCAGVPFGCTGCAALHTRAAFVAAARGGVAAPPPAPPAGGLSLRMDKDSEGSRVALRVPTGREREGRPALTRCVFGTGM